MNKSLRIYLFALIALIAVILLIDAGRKKPISWIPTYSVNDKIPLGLYVLNQEIKTILGDSIVQYDKTPYEYFKEDTSNAQRTFMYINKHLAFDEESINSLLNVVNNGSTLFMSIENLDYYLPDTLNIHQAYEYISPQFFKKDTLELLFTHPQWNETYLLSPVFGQNRFSQLDTATTSVLGFMKYKGSSKYINFVKVNVGKGTIYLHNQPAVFSNFAMLSELNLSEYAARTLSYLPQDQSVTWFVDKPLDKVKTKTILSVIFNYPSLRAAWLIFLYGMILFIFFHAKRKQRVVPIITPPKNTTVEFTQTIGNLYYQEGDTGNIVQKKIVYFLDKIRTHYYLDTQKLDNEFIRKLHLKSNKDIALIKNIVQFIQWFEKNQTASQHDLIRLNEFIEEFWSKKETN